MMEMLSLPFIQRALLAGLMVGFLSAYYGSFVVQRGLSFLGNGLAHAAFGGVALGILLNQQPLALAIPFTALVAAGIIWLQQRTDLSADTSIGIFFSVSMALGIIFLSRTDHYTTDAFTYLFGTILAVRGTDLWATSAVVVLALATWKFWGRWAYATFDREFARSDGLSCLKHDYLLAMCLAITIVVSIKLVGITLIAAFLVIPPAAARLFARTFSGMTIISVVIGMGSVLVGMILSYHWNLPTGPAIILVQAAVFLGMMLGTKRR